MRIRRYDAGFSRRLFCSRVAGGVIASGVLAPLWKVLAAEGDASRAYPDELLSIEVHTKGRIKPGDRITAANVDAVRDLLDPIRLDQIVRMGRVLDVAAPTTDLLRLSPHDYVEATLRNAGQARFAADGNVVSADGGPWIGGHPFPSPTSALQIVAGQTLSWGRHDASVFACRESDLDAAGTVAYRYDSVWAELSPVGRVTMEPRPYWPGHETTLRYQAVYFLSPMESRGGFLSTWPYDQNQLPELVGYLPAFKRIRRLPTNQRFEPLIPGSSLYLSDAWTTGDPFLMWGNYHIVHQGPALAALSGNWQADHPNWERGTHGGPYGLTFWDTTVELVPEAIVVEAEPIGFPRAPVSRKRIWFDARTLLPFLMVSYDRKGQLFRSFDGAYSQYTSDENRVMDGAHPYWSWTHIHAHDVQTDRMTRIEQVRSVGGGHHMRVNSPDIYDAYLTHNALRRHGS